MEDEVVVLHFLPLPLPLAPAPGLVLLKPKPEASDCSLGASEGLLCLSNYEGLFGVSSAFASSPSFLALKLLLAKPVSAGS